MVKASQLGYILGKGIPQARLGKAVTKKSLESAQTVSNDLFGYDFTGLALKLFVYFAIALVFSKFMEAVIFTRGAWVTVSNLLGFGVPSADKIPDSVKKLFDGGIGGFKFWDLVKVVAILLIITEYFRYRNANKKANSETSPMTTGIFVLLISVLAVTTVPELITRLKETDFNLEGLR